MFMTLPKDLEFNIGLVEQCWQFQGLLSQQSEALLCSDNKTDCSVRSILIEDPAIFVANIYINIFIRTSYNMKLIVLF